ncbi:MAG: hypothetical protein RIS79_2973 [Verrucomicrobiota bacterium]|jgi:threonine dehydratase
MDREDLPLDRRLRQEVPEARERLETYWPGIEIVGVEGVGQALMKAALEAGKPVELHDLDIFCDGAAVRKAGTLPFDICRTMLNRIATVTNAEVSAAIRVLWESLRCISEPSGAMGLAAVLKERAEFAGKKVLIVITGANIDFLQLGLIAQSEGAASTVSRTLRINIPERPGAMLSLLDSCFEGLNIADFQYGLHHADQAWPVFTVTAESATKLAELPTRLDAGGFQWQDLIGAVDVAFRAIPMRGDLLTHPLFLLLIRDRASLCYFNYRQSGERVGRALIGLTFQNASSREAFLLDPPEQGEGYRSCKPVDEATFTRMTA